MAPFKRLYLNCPQQDRLGEILPLGSQDRVLSFQDRVLSFVGSWKLIAADKLLPDGTRVADYGAQPHGMAIFTADGHMTIEVFRDVRIKFAGNDRAKGTFEEYKDASLSSSCLFGTYSVDTATGKVTMKIDRSTFPNYDDTTQVRAYELTGDILSWRVPARPDGSIPITVLRRVAQ